MTLDPGFRSWTDARARNKPYVPTDCAKTPCILREPQHERVVELVKSSTLPFALSPVEGRRLSFTQSGEANGFLCLNWTKGVNLVAG